MSQNASHNFDEDFPKRLHARLQQPLPGRAAQRRFSPELSYGRHFWLDRRDAISAATAVVLVHHQGAWQIPLTLRTANLTSHAGQICLPGGRIDDGESPERAALREVEEELRIPRAHLQTLGALSPLYLYASNFHVTPFVTVCIEERCHVDPNPDEVAALLWLSISELVDPSNRGPSIRGQQMTRNIANNVENNAVENNAVENNAVENNAVENNDVELASPHFVVGQHCVWGATAMMLREFAEVIAQCPSR